MKETATDGARNTGPALAVFISHSHVDRKFAGQAKAVFGRAGIDAFVAHDDLRTSEEWQSRIRDELRRCQLFVPLLSKSFLRSRWTLQEVGFIASRPEVKIAPLSIDETIPFGFLSHLQSGRISSDGVTRKLLVEPLARHFPRTIIPYLIRVAGQAGSFRLAEAEMRPLVPLFGLFTIEEAQALAEAAIRNGQIWSARQCRDEFLPEFIRVQGSNLKAETLRALRYQIERGEWYRASA